jgi:serine/threonine protein kinase
VLAPHLASTPEFHARFLREARAAAAVRHPNVIAVHAVSEHRRLPYLVMELVHGPTLQDWLDRQGPPSVETILELSIAIADGLAAAHGQGVIHRDVKPANVLLDREPDSDLPRAEAFPGVRIVDFGLARAAEESGLTRTGVIAGTPNFMAPEQATGSATDHRTDLFALGAVIYTLCTGRPPFAGETPIAVLFNVCHADPRPMRELNPMVTEWLAALVAKLMAKLPAERYASASEVADLMRQYLRHLRAPGNSPAPPTPVAPISVGPRARSTEYRSKTTVLGWPLVHIVSGPDPATGKTQTARGILAIGTRAVGVVALGANVRGVIALGALASGVIALGGGAVGLVAFGGFAIGALAMGGFTGGGVAVGGLAVAYYAYGGIALGVHTFSSTRQDPAAVEFLNYFWDTSHWGLHQR